ncbi:MAG: TadE/TadG family type IV pilus assembly protein [Candidatus Nanopelagicales bacterium]
MDRLRRDDGSAVVGFVVVVPLLVLLLLAVVQVGLALHVRSTLQSAAAEGARVAAVSGGDPALARRRIEDALSQSFADGVVESVSARPVREAGVVAIEVEVRARLPLIGLLGPSALVVTGHALAEP